MIYDLLIAPFADFGFMKRALVASLCLAVGGSSIGVFLILRRMSLMGDALAHALLPGAALGFLLGGLSLPAMSLGGFLAGITTALVSGAIARFTSMREDASFAAAYLTALALGVLIVSLRGSAVDLMNILFGAILAVDRTALLLVAGTTTLTLAGLAAIYRPLVVECFNPGFLAAMGVRGALYHSLFLGLAVLNMVAAFQALGSRRSAAPPSRAPGPPCWTAWSGCRWWGSSKHCGRSRPTTGCWPGCATRSGPSVMISSFSWTTPATTCAPRRRRARPASRYSTTSRRKCGRGAWGGSASSRRSGAWP